MLYYAVIRIVVVPATGLINMTELKTGSTLKNDLGLSQQLS